MKTEKKQKAKVVKQKFSCQLMWKQRYLLLMSVPFVIWLIIFKYVPLWGWTMAFQEVKPNSFALPVWQRKFVGFDNFKKAYDRSECAGNCTWNRHGDPVCTHAQ